MTSDRDPIADAVWIAAVNRYVDSLPLHRTLAVIIGHVVRRMIIGAQYADDWLCRRVEAAAMIMDDERPDNVTELRRRMHP